MKLLSWNMAGGFAYEPERHERAWRFLEDANPDVALLQEAVVPEWASSHWPFIHHARKYPLKAGRDDVPWGSAVIARSAAMEPFVPRVEAQPLLSVVGGSVAIARRIGPSPMWFASIHSNAYPLSAEQLASWSIAEVRRCDPKDVWEVELIAHGLERLFTSSRFVAGGDLNSALLFDETYGRTSNARLFENLASAGFIDLRGRFFETEQQTYFKPGKGLYQLDHVFADGRSADAAVSWRVVRDIAAVEDLSDHAPVEVVLDS